MAIINKTYLKQYSLFPKNYDLTEVMNFLDVTEALFVRPLLGTALYDEIVKQVKDDDLSPENATLLTDGGLWRYLGACFTLQAIPFAYAHVSQVGVTKGKSENSDSVELKDISYLTSHLRSTMEELKKFTYKWLLEHEDSFPLWDPDEQACGCSRPVSCCEGGGLSKPEPRPIVYNLPRKDDTIS